MSSAVIIHDYSTYSKGIKTFLGPFAQQVYLNKGRYSSFVFLLKPLSPRLSTVVAAIEPTQTPKTGIGIITLFY